MRELRSELTRLTLADPARHIDADAVADPAMPCPVTGMPPRGLRALLTDQVRAVHRELGGNVAGTARRLGVSRNTVYRALSG